MVTTKIRQDDICVLRRIGGNEMKKYKRIEKKVDKGGKEND